MSSRAEDTMWGKPSSLLEKKSLSHRDYQHDALLQYRQLYLDKDTERAVMEQHDLHLCIVPHYTQHEQQLFLILLFPVAHKQTSEHHFVGIRKWYCQMVASHSKRDSR